MTKYFMNPNTGSVDTLYGWDVDSEKEAIAEGLIEVVKDDDGDWVEA